jgi:hypothetical protein
MVRVAFFNANGLAGKDPDILEFYQRQDIDVFCVLETWNTTGKSPVINNNFINLTKTSDQVTAGGRRSGGGILCFAKPSLRGQISVLYTDEHQDFAIFELGSAIYGVAYLSPSTADAKLSLFLDKCQEIAGDRRFFAFGDFNARTKLANDHAENPRGLLLQDYLLENPVFLWPAEEGRYSSFSTRGDGRAVPDLLLSNGDEPREVIIHERNSLGGSDHRPITFIVTDPLICTREFSRWDIRKLSQPAVLERYENTLESTRNSMMGDLIASENIENSWSLVKSWIENAAKQSCGYLRYRNTSYGEFFDDKLKRLKARLLVAEESWLKSARCRDIPLRNAARIAFSNLKKEYRSAVSSRKTSVFTETANNLSRPANIPSLQKRIKCAESRNNRKGCKLKKEDIEIHAGHFATTFGQHPAGASAYNQPEGEYIARTVATGDVVFVLGQLALGKAPGVDGIMPEFFCFAKEQVSIALAVLFNQIFQQCEIPKDWSEALVVPVYKNKGSDQDAANYRPISLTAICRRAFERLILQDLQENISLLSDTQGGFRKNRSTLDLCFCLEEVMLENPEAVYGFLDIRAAFDTVNREILWKRMYHEYNVPYSTIQILKALFDNNTSYLVIYGERSSAIANLRGLMQGSSLSPILFSFFIDPLLKRLKSEQQIRLFVGNLKSNHNAFADDLEIHARRAADLQVLLDICGEWSIANGIRFQPQKCAILGPDDQENSGLTIYGEQLPQKREIIYLGLPFTVNRVDHAVNVEKRCAKARSIASSLAKHGLNLSGFPQYASAILYKTFIRPVMEYGIQLRVLKGKTAAVLQKTQNFALRLIFSAHRNTSVNAMQKLLMLEPMAVRNQVLNLKFGARLHNSNDSSRPPVLYWRQAFPLQKVGSTTRSTRFNPLFTQALFKPIFGRNLQRGIEVKVSPAFESEILKGIIRRIISELDLGNTNVAGMIQVDATQTSLRHVLMPYAFQNPLIRVPILRWLVGNVAIHRPCQAENCDSEISRRHAVECSGAEEGLMETYPWLVPGYDPVIYSTFIDYLLNRFAQAHKVQDRPKDLYLNISAAIGAIYHHCLGYQQRENGFYAEPAAQQDSQQSSMFGQDMQEGEPQDPG